MHENARNVKLNYKLVLPRGIYDNINTDRITGPVNKPRGLGRTPSMLFRQISYLIIGTFPGTGKPNI